MYVSVVNSKEIRGYDNDTLRKVKSDKADAKKIAEYGLAKWDKIRRYEPQDKRHQTLKSYSRQYERYSKLKTMLKNNLKELLEQTFPGISDIFKSPVRNDGHEK